MVIMKYIENPLTIKSRKMDIRMWVLITDWNPLTIWVFEECYIRLAYSSYSPDNNDLQSHITNNKVYQAIVEENKGLISSVSSTVSNLIGSKDDEDDDDLGNLLSLNDFKVKLSKNYSSNAWDDQIFPDIKQVIKASMSAVKKDFKDARKNTFEFYGFDFMIDDLLNVWLIEINSAPSLGSLQKSPIKKHLV